MKIVILNDTSYEAHHGCEVVVGNIKKLALKNGMEVIDTHPVGVNWQESQTFLENISKCDLVLVNGEGALHHAQLRARELITIAKYVKENTGVPVVLINSTYQDNGNEMAEYMKYFDLVYVRETLSKNDLEKYGIQSKVVPDMTFYSKFDLSEKIVSDDIGVSDSVYLELSEELFELCVENNYKYFPALTSPKIRLNSVRNIARYLKHSVFVSIKFLLYKLGLKFSHQIVRAFFYVGNYKDYIQEISRLNFLIAGRYHSLCFALKTLTPFIAIKSNSHKIEGMLHDIGIGEKRIIDRQNLNQFHMKEFVEDEIDKILTYVDNAPLKIEAMFEEIREILDK
jgi:hypothetical protein